MLSKVGFTGMEVKRPPIERKNFLFACTVFFAVCSPLTAAGTDRFDRSATDAGPSAALSMAKQQAALEYWTPEKMRAALPMRAPQANRKPIPPLLDALDVPDWLANDSATASAGYVPGWNPASTETPPAWDDYHYLNAEHDGPVPSIQAQATALGSAPSDPLNGPYAPFQRRSLLGKYRNYPRSVIGKLFFTLGGTNRVCTGSVIQRNTVATAGHCNFGGSGLFASNRIFCPSYNSNGVHPQRGCWAVIDSKTNNLWQVTLDPDRDHACLITAPTGDTVADSIGNVTGWAGRAFNWGASQPTEAFGYAAASPFDGHLITQTSGPEWYEVDFEPPSADHVSKCIGNDMTEGANGGPWYISWNNPVWEAADTDNNDATDPGNGSGGLLLNGLNSHKRCAGSSCVVPPTPSTGLFWQEMCSPPFRHTIDDPDESEDVFAVCFANGGA